MKAAFIFVFIAFILTGGLVLCKEYKTEFEDEGKAELEEVDKTELENENKTEFEDQDQSEFDDEDKTEFDDALAKWMIHRENRDVSFQKANTSI